jgi:hypothetical protein
MNEFASTLSAALHEEAQEIAMSADIQHAERKLQESIRSLDRRRRVWIAVAAAAAILVVVAGVTLGVKRSPAQPAQPKPPSASQRAQQLTGPIPFDHFNPQLTVQLPLWIGKSDTYLRGAHYDQPNGDRALALFSVDYMYPAGATKITHPDYAALVNDWKALPTHTGATVRDVTETAVDGQPATMMTVSLTRQVDGFAYCEAVTNVRTDTNSCVSIFPGRTYHIAIVDHGSTKPPTLLWESSTTDFTSNATNSGAEIAKEFAAWRATVRFG